VPSAASAQRLELHLANSIVIITQVCVPESAAAGKQIADVAEELVRLGWRVSFTPPAEATTIRRCGIRCTRPEPESWCGVVLYRASVSLRSPRDFAPMACSSPVVRWPMVTRANDLRETA